MDGRSIGSTHPDDMTADVDLRFGNAVMKASARATPAGLVCVGLLVSAILLSTAVLVKAAKG